MFLCIDESKLFQFEGCEIPLMLIESPKWTSSRIGPTSAIVTEYPFPPDCEVSMGANSVIVPICSTGRQFMRLERNLPIPVNMVCLCL